MSDVDNEPESDLYHCTLGLFETALMVHAEAHGEALARSTCDDFYKILLQDWMDTVYD